MISIRNANEGDVAEIENMVADFVKGHPAEHHPRSSQALCAAYFGERPVAHMLIAKRNGEIVGMAQWRLVHDVFWGMFGAEAEWLYVKPNCRGSGVVAALIARVCAQAAQAGARLLHGGGGNRQSKLYERVAIGMESRECHLSGKAFRIFAELDGLPVREIIRRLPPRELGLQPTEP